MKPRRNFLQALIGLVVAPEVLDATPVVAPAVVLPDADATRRKWAKAAETFYSGEDFYKQFEGAAGSSSPIFLVGRNS